MGQALLCYWPKYLSGFLVCLGNQYIVPENRNPGGRIDIESF